MFWQSNIQHLNVLYMIEFIWMIASRSLTCPGAKCAQAIPPICALHKYTVMYSHQVYILLVQFMLSTIFSLIGQDGKGLLN